MIPKRRAVRNVVKRCFSIFIPSLLPGERTPFQQEIIPDKIVSEFLAFSLTVCFSVQIQHFEGRSLYHCSKTVPRSLFSPVGFAVITPVNNGLVPIKPLQLSFQHMNINPTPQNGVNDSVISCDLWVVIFEERCCYFNQSLYCFHLCLALNRILVLFVDEFKAFSLYET